MLGISVFNQKGGVGKTTLACALSLYLAERGMRVLAADVDSQSNMSQYFLHGPEYRKFHDGEAPSVSDVLRSPGDDTLANRVILPVHNALSGGKVSLIPARPDLWLATVENLEALRIFLGPVANAFDVLIIDCPPGRSRVTRAAWNASDVMIIPTDLTYFCAMGLAQVRFALLDHKMQTGRVLKVAGVVFNRRSSGVSAREGEDELLRLCEDNAWYLATPIIPPSGANLFDKRMRRGLTPYGGVGATRQLRDVCLDLFRRLEEHHNLCGAST